MAEPTKPATPVAAPAAAQATTPPAVAKPATPPVAAKPAGSTNVSPSGSKGQIVKPPPFKLGAPTDVSPYLKLLVYSDPGLGKTTLIGSAADVPQMQDPIWIDCEKGELTVLDNERITNFQSLLDNRIPVSTFKEIPPIHDWLKGHCRARDAYIANPTEVNENILRAEEARLRGCHKDDIVKPKLFRTVLFDSLHEANAFSLYELLGVEESKVMAGDKDETDVAGWTEFRMNMQRMNMLIRAFRDLPMNFLATAHAQYKQDELKKFYYEPALSGQLARQVQGFFDIVGFMKVEKSGDKFERRVYVQPVSNFHAKNRRSVFKGNFFADPTMQSIMQQTGLIKS